MDWGYLRTIPRSFLFTLQFSILAIILVLASGHAKAATLTVPAGGSLQSAINAAQPGDTIILAAGATYTGDFVLPNKSGSTYITIQSSRVDELPEGVRVGPAQSALMARLQNASSASPIIVAALGSHHYRLVGLEIATATPALVYDLVRFGENSQTAAQVPHDFVIDRSWIHGHSTQDVQRGVTLNGAEITVSNSYISDIHGRGYDTQALCGWNGPGPFHIINNYLEASGENVMFGGALPSITNLIPSNIEIKRNYFFKPLSWKVGDPAYAGIHWSVKNLLEFKNARNVVVDGNVLENCWTDAQIGYAILFTVRSEDGKAPWATVENITFTNNTVKNSDQGFQMLGTDYPNPSGRGNNLTLSNNLFIGIANRFLTMTGFYNVTFNHNTHLQSGNVTALYGEPSIGFVYTNNITTRSGFGFFGDGKGEGNPALTAYVPSAVFQKNLIAGAPTSIYPTNNFYPSSITGILDSNYRVVTSTYQAAGTDGEAVGCDIDALNAAQSGAAPSPSPTPTPTPTATPTPSPSPTATPTPSPSPSPTATPTPSPSPTATPTPTPIPTPTPTPTPAPSPSASAAFVQLDTTTRGNWKNTYGGDGYNTVNDTVNYPSWAQVNVTGYSSSTWMASTTDVRALQKTAGSDRLAARWESSSFFTIDLNLTDNQTHRVALYGLDWDGNNRSQRIDLIDWATNSLLDSRIISTFNGGQYLVWDVRGRVKIVVNKIGAKTAVVSGIYFGGASATPTPTPTPTPSPSPTPTPVQGAPQVTLTVPPAGATFVAGEDITMTATASDPNGSITSVEFYRSGTLVGTDTSSPYSVIWTNAQKGTYELTAKAYDNGGLSTVSAPVSITVTNSPNSINRAKGRANSLVQQDYAGAADGGTVTNASLASDISLLTSDIEQAYSEFKAESTSFGSTAASIDVQVKAALLFTKASAGLAMRAASSPNIKNNLVRIQSHLAMAEDLMRYGRVTLSTATDAVAARARMSIVIGNATTGYGMTSISPVAPSSLGSIAGVGNVQPMIGQTVFALLQSDGGLPYEVGGLSVSVGGVAVPVLYASPWGIKFFMPADIPLGVAEVIVSSQDGYICQGLVSVERSGSRLMTTTDDDNGVLVASNNRKQTTSNFEVETLENLSLDKRTRLSIFATGISASAVNSNPNNDIKVDGNVRINYAESLSVEARLSNGQVLTLPVEFAGAQGVLPGLDQVNVILIPQLKGAGNVQLTLIFNGQRSNAPSVFIK